MRLVIRKLGSEGDTLLTCAEEELEERLVPELEEGYCLAVRKGEVTRLLGDDPEIVRETVRDEASRGAEQLELLLIPRVSGG